MKTKSNCQCQKWSRIVVNQKGQSKISENITKILSRKCQKGKKKVALTSKDITNTQKVEAHSNGVKSNRIISK